MTTIRNYEFIKVQNSPFPKAYGFTMKPGIIFILESISQPRCIKRINSFIDHGYDVKIYGFDRGKYRSNASVPGKKIKVVGRLSDGKGYWAKLAGVNFIIKNIVRENSKTDNIYYSFGFMITFLLMLNGVKKFIYEISDIIYGYRHFKWIRGILIRIDRYLISKSLLTILTSEGFLKLFFKDRVPENVLVQPNRLDPSFLKMGRTECSKFKQTGELVFSFIGAFRSENTIFRFARIIGENYPRLSFYFFGESHLTDEVKEIANKYSNVKFFGPFKNPEDLSSIYEQIDIVVACYDTRELNERILEPNKLFESIYFRKPIIVSKNTFLEDKVRKYGCGFSIDASNDENIKNFIELIDLSELNQIIDNISTISLNEIIDDNAQPIISYLGMNNI